MTRVAVVLLNLGGPDTQSAVEPFLFNLFNDPAILRLPQPLRGALAWLIAHRRAPTARRIYAHLGGCSPLLANTRAQAAALEAALAGEAITARVFIAMRYWHPMSKATATAVAAYRPDELLLLPLYPQYSTTTTASSLAAWKRSAAAIGLSVPTRAVCCFPAEEGFIAALAELTRAGLEEARRRVPAGTPRIIFSAHGLPLRIAQAGDPYVEQVEHTCQALATRLELAAGDWQLGFQSRIGPLAWVGPPTDALILAAAKEKRAILVVPVAFVSEHSETLVELDIDYRRLASESGGEIYIRVPTVGCHPAFIVGLARSLRDARRAETELYAVGRGCSPAAGRCPQKGLSPR
jgi:protoporphyrin/coproporphyrin ferrochelatase